MSPVHAVAEGTGPVSVADPLPRLCEDSIGDCEGGLEALAPILSLLKGARLRLGFKSLDGL